MLHPDRLFPANPIALSLSRALFEAVEHLPIVSPHGHTEPRWWGENPSFSNPAELFVIPDHYVVRMLVSQGVSYETLGIGAQADPREVWRCFASNYHLFRGTPSRLWLDHSLWDLFGIEDRLNAANADAHYDRIAEQLADPGFSPRAIYEKFNVEVIATTDSALDDLRWHKMARASGWTGRVLPTYRPDAIVDPDAEDFSRNLDRLAGLTGRDTGSWQGYLDAHRDRRAFFRSMGATATDHGHPTARTADLSDRDAAQLYDRIRTGKSDVGDAELFRAQMLTEMARMSIEDGMVMQLHAGSSRNHNRAVHAAYGRDRGFDIPQPTSFTEALKPLLNVAGMDKRLTLILFTLDESTYSRELAPLAGAYPSLRLGPPWWFHDSFEGIRRFRETATETAGFYNTAGFNDDTRALCSIKARHDVSRRADCAFLAELVTTHRLDEQEAYELAPLLAGDLARQAYKL